MSEETRKALEEEARREVFERYTCYSDIEGNVNVKLHDKIIKLIIKQNVKIEGARATLKNLLLGMYAMEVGDEMGL